MGFWSKANITTSEEAVAVAKAMSKRSVKAILDNIPRFLFILAKLYGFNKNAQCGKIEKLIYIYEKSMNKFKKS